MKKLGTLLSVAALGATVTACSPSPEDVCDHMTELLTKEMGEEAAKQLDKGECVKQVEREKEMRGLVKYREQAGCVMDASSFADIEKCKEAEKES